MDEKAQKEGEGRVQALLISPLEAMGLAKPSTLTKDKFEAMKAELRQKLAYMTEGGLITLRDWCEEHPGGKDGDRFPIALKILKRARQLETPAAGPSPLMLKIFADPLGQDALAKGYAPELLAYVRATREYPGNWTVSKIKAAADEPVRRLIDIEMRMARGDQMAPEDLAFRDQRRAALRKCEEIAQQARNSSAA